MSTTKVPKYNLGDVVKLNAGGPEMVIYSLKPSRLQSSFLGDYTCQWFSGKKLESGVFKEESLVLVRKQGEQTDGNESGT